LGIRNITAEYVKYGKNDENLEQRGYLKWNCRNIWQFYIATCEQQGQQPSNPGPKIYPTNKGYAVNVKEKLFKEQKADLMDDDVTDLEDSAFE
jgi:hypothetical protein